MVDALYIAASGLQGEQAQIDTISNNLANMQTPGFKSSRVSFADVATITPAQVQQGVRNDRAGAGLETLATRPEFTEGTLKQTGSPFDLAIEGPGFLEVETTSGVHVFTRAGQLHVDQEGYLATVNGDRLADEVQIPPDAKDITIDTTGQVSAILGTDVDPTILGRIQLSTFMSPEALQAVGGNAYVPTEQSGDPSIGRPGDDGFGTLRQGMVEQSNVDMVQEMTNLVLAQRAYQLNARVLQAADQILDTINNLRR
jgi:flagellar basal-body rod protein FlgG